MKDFFDELNHLARPRRPDIIEKDFHLHRLLGKISDDDYLSRILVMKGGTCLIKGYAGYYRFSEDLDFTWNDPGRWEGKTSVQVRKECSKEIDTLIRHLVPIAHALGLEFRGDKTDMGEVIIGGGGRMPRFYLGYHSSILDTRATVKVEINFIEKIQYPCRTRDMMSYVRGMDSGRVRFLYGELWKEYAAPVSIRCYDPREIFVEKCRAALTRIAYKPRDIVDICWLEQYYGYSIPGFEKSIVEKTRFMLEHYRKYRESIRDKVLPDPREIGADDLTLLDGHPSVNMEGCFRRIHQQLEGILQTMKELDLPDAIPEEHLPARDEFLH